MSRATARRVVTRYLIATDDEDKTLDLMNSLNRLVKSKGGLFASSKQAAFMFSALKTYGDEPAFLRSWASPYLRSPGSFAIVLMAHDKRFGHSIQKGRFFAFAYVIDGAGVVAQAKVEIAHPKEGDGQIRAIPVGIASTNFERQGDAPVLYDHGKAESDKAERERKHVEQIEKNQEMIQKLRHLEETDQRAHENPLILSFIQQLEAGKALSPAQLGVLRKFMEVKIDDSKWKSTRDQSFELTEDRLIKPAIKFYQHAVIPGFEFTKEIAREIEHEWKAFRAKPVANLEVGAGSHEFKVLAENCGWRKPAGVAGYLTLLAKMDAIAKKGEAKAPRTLLKLVRPMEYYLQWIERLSPSEVQAALEKHYA